MDVLSVLRVIAAIALVAVSVFASMVIVGVFTALDSATVAYGSSGFWSTF